MYRVSEDFKRAYESYAAPRYRLALAVGVHPAWLSKVVNGQVNVEPLDPRIVAVGKLFGLAPRECFAPLPTQEQKEEEHGCRD